jgi:hypothetical protein
MIPTFSLVVYFGTANRAGPARTLIFFAHFAIFLAHFAVKSF